MKNRVFLLVVVLFALLPAFSQDEQELAKADYLLSKSYQLYKANKYQEAIEIMTQVLDIQEKNLGKEDIDNALPIGSLALYNRALGNYTEAIRWEMQALNIYEKNYGKEHPDYIMALNILATYNNDLANYSEAIRLETEVLAIREKVLGKEHPDYATSLNSLAYYNSSLGNYSEAIHLTTEALAIREKVLGKEHPDYATSLNSLAYYNSFLGNYSEAIRLGTEALVIREKVLGKEHPDYANSLVNLASYNSGLGNYSEAIRLVAEALNIYGKVLGKEHPNYATSLSNLANYNYYLGNYSEAIRLETEALNIREKVLGKEHPDYTTSLNNLASCNSDLGNYSEAIRLGTEALNIREKVLGKKHPAYVTSLSNLANYNSDLGNYSEAIRLEAEALTIREKVLGKEHPAYATSLNNLANYNGSLGNYSEAIRLGTEALTILEKTLGKDHPDYALSLSNLAGYHYSANDIQGLTQYASRATNLSKKIIRTTFSNLTLSERSMYWNKHKSWFSDWITDFAYRFPTDSLIVNAYNGTLLAKGLLLNSELEMNKLLQESGDAALSDLYNELKTNRQVLNKLYEKPIAERMLDTDSLERVANGLERELVERSKVYGDYTRNLSIDWKDVQRQLGKSDVAIEFVSFPYTKDSTMYVAYVVDAAMKTPQMVPLFEAKELSAISPADYYTTPEVSKLVWEKLDGYLTDNVYFAPAGNLYNVAIESLPDYKGDGLLSDHRRFYRLSSTRELAVTREKPRMKEAVLYGGLIYDTDVEYMAEDGKKYASDGSRDMSLGLPNAIDSLNLRGGASYLPATIIEVENIDHALQQTTIQSVLFAGNEGTEASFKDLSGKKKNLLHIATHGFYWSKEEVELKDDYRFLMYDEGRAVRNTEDKALTRSGLLFAGANNALRRKALPENVEDGILTAKEIASLDLRELDLVVLSACQTGLGEITGDGVFGLQRGFKKAGANTLMMSLWKVNDDATQLLMTKFYENLTAGKSKYESLRDAQRFVREYEIDVEATNELSILGQKLQDKFTKNEPATKVHPYQNPNYWAAFILLDGIK